MRRRLWLVGAALALALTAGAACSGDGDGDGIPSADGDGAASGEQTELTDHEQGVAFAECMREHGVDMPDPDPNGGGGLMFRGATDRELMREALEACRDLMPERLRDGEMDPETLAQLQQFAECMREHGIDMPDPDPNGGGMRILSDTDRDDQEFQAAFEACQEHLAGLRGGMQG